MSKFAVVKVSGSQFEVKEGDLIEVSRLSAKEGEKVDLEEVLLFSDEGKVKVGKPTVEGVKVSAKVEKQFQGEKLHISRFKAKTGYRKKIGFRPMITQLRIETISA